jgi:hypothetical protein
MIWFDLISDCDLEEELKKSGTSWVEEGGIF